MVADRSPVSVVGVPRLAGGGDRRRLRLRLALAAGRTAAGASRALHAGRGAVVGGRVTARLAPDALRALAAGRHIVLVSGTNGKSTTTRMLVEALGGPAEVATNSEGANMGAGLVAALSRRPDARIAVLEVDELHLPGIVRQVDPDVLVLLNLSRDQLDRTSEVRTVAQHVRDAVEAAPAAVVVANADDVLVVDAVGSARQVVWVAGGSAWQQDSSACPSCGAVVHHQGDEWWCTCGLRRPGPRWTATETDLVAPDGLRVPLRIALPGAANRGNAAMAVAAAARVGTDPEVAALRVARVREVDGRYRTVSRGARQVTMLLAKNPAGWAEALTMLDGRAGHVVVAVNGQGPDGRDLSWLWDVAFEELRGRSVSAAGERCADLAVRLTYADLPHLVRRDPVRAIDDAPPGRVTVLANYTAFTALRHALNAPAA